MKEFKKQISKEYWITQDGERKYPHEFEDEHLANTIRYLHKITRRYRLEEARVLCELAYKIGHRDADIERYYGAFKRQMDDFLGGLDDKQWLKENSKIYILLIEEADYRKIDYDDKSTKVKYTGNVEGKKKFKSTFKYLFNA